MLATTAFVNTRFGELEVHNADKKNIRDFLSDQQGVTKILKGAESSHYDLGVHMMNWIKTHLPNNIVASEVQDVVFFYFDDGETQCLTGYKIDYVGNQTKEYEQAIYG